jgi:hypothetical protein
METPSQPQASQIPDLVKIGSVATDTAMKHDLSLTTRASFTPTPELLFQRQVIQTHQGMLVPFSQQMLAFIH